MTSIANSTRPTLLIEDVKELKAANDNLVSKTKALEAQLKSANDNHQAEMNELRRELQVLRNHSPARPAGAIGAPVGVPGTTGGCSIPPKPASACSDGSWTLSPTGGQGPARWNGDVRRGYRGSPLASPHARLPAEPSLGHAEALHVVFNPAQLNPRAIAATFRPRLDPNPGWVELYCQ
jgi:hypothetical protein